MIASSAFYSTTQGIQSLIEKTIELNSALVNLQRVADGDQFEFNTIIERAIDNVSELSGKTSEYLELLNEFARQGSTLNESLDLADTTTMLLNVSDLSAKESMDALTSSMINFGIAAEDSARIADKLNEVDNNYAITTRDLALSLKY